MSVRLLVWSSAVVSLALSVACGRKPPDPMQQCSAGHAAQCAAICDTQPGPVCEVSADGDPAHAVAYLDKACDAKDAMACQRVVVAYTQGTGGVTKDAAKARAYADKTCALGDGLIACKQARSLVGTP